MPSSKIEPVVVIGGGPAGLAVAGCLMQRGVWALVLEAGPSVGSSWRGRYDRLRLNTVRWLSGLPGRPMPRSYGPWVARDDYVAYLEAYAIERRLRVRYNSEAVRVRPGESVEARWQVQLRGGDILPARDVVVATGYDRVAVMPPWPGRDRFTGTLIHAGAYRNAAPYADQHVLIAGAGATGLELAVDLAEAGAQTVTVAVRTPPAHFGRALWGVPLTPLGKMDPWTPAWLGDRLGSGLAWLQHGNLAPYGLPRPAVGLATMLRTRGKGPVIVDGLVPLLQSGRIQIVGQVLDLEPHGARCAARPGAAQEVHLAVDAVIAATGYRRGLEHLLGDLHVLDADGTPNPARLPEGLHAVGYRIPLTGQLSAHARDAQNLARALTH